MEYKPRKVVWIPEEVGGRKVKIRTEVVEGEVPWIIGQDWMEEWGMVINVGNTEVELRKLGICVKCTVDGWRHTRMELRQRKKEQGWWESRWICDQDRLKILSVESVLHRPLGDHEQKWKKKKKSPDCE